MTIIYLLTGSNLGKRAFQLQKACRLCHSQIGEVLRKSDLYETEAWGNINQPVFLNQVLEIQTTLTPDGVLQQIFVIEHQLGRQRVEKWGQRRIDIDILLFGEEVINTPDLQIPHPYLPQRRFALTPLAQLVPEMQHPVLYLPIAKLLEQCPDELRVWKYGTGAQP